MDQLVILIIIAITAITSIRAFNDMILFDRMKFNAAYMESNKEWYRFLSYGLVHVDWFHLIVNMYVLYIFGKPVIWGLQDLFGMFANIAFIVLYVSALFVSTIASFIKNRNNYAYNAVGASGAVSAILFTSILFYPVESSIGLLFIPGKIPAWLFGILYLMYSAYMSKRNVDNVGHDAHFWGAVWGFVLPVAIHPFLLPRFFESIFNAYF